MSEAALDDRVGNGRRALHRLRQRIDRARRHPGHERDVALLLAKSAFAGVVAWTLAEYAVRSAQPTYAPFVALLVVQSTVYRSLLNSVQYVGAVVAGVLVAGAMNPLFGENVAGFAVMLVVGLLIGRWRRLGSMGIQAPVGGIFAYSALMGPSHESMLWSIVSMVLLGAGVGLATNLLLLPPMRYTTADQGVQELTTAFSSLLRDVAEGLRDSPAMPDTAEDWVTRARQLDETAGKARAAVEHGAESVSYNPRRLLRRRMNTSFAGYRTMVEALERAGEQVRSIAYGLRRLIGDGNGGPVGDDFYREYADVLDLIADSGQEVGSTGREAGERLERIVRECSERCERLEEKVRDSEAWPALGALLTDADRLLVEFRQAHDRGAVRAD